MHFELSKRSVSEEVKRFNTYFKALSKKRQKDLYGGTGSSVAKYKKCMRCGESYKKFVDYKEGDMPDGCTINPIMCRED